ncbi:MAG: hypothetical protein Q7J25_10235 [Vicinamibacterales bacterium]|nr:hypothetical protein [Vicinamibacterales bacterium]
MPPKKKQVSDINPSDNYAAIEEAAHLKAKSIAVDVLGPLGNPEKPEEYEPTFSVINDVRKRCIYMSEDGDLNDGLIEDAVVELRFAIGWAQPLTKHPLTVAEAIQAFDALDTEPNMEDKVNDLHEQLDADEDEDDE